MLSVQEICFRISCSGVSMTNKAPSGTKKQHKSTEPEFAMSVLTFCFLISWTMFQQHQPTHEVSEPNALLCCSKCTEYGLPKQQSSITNTHTGWSSLSTQHYNQMYKQLGLCHPLFHYLQYEWWPKYCIMWMLRAEGRWSVRRLQQSPSTSVYLVPSTIPSNPPGLHIVHEQ